MSRNIGQAERRRRKLARLITMQRGRCSICNAKMIVTRRSSNDPGMQILDPREATVDHIVPKAAGGIVSAIENMQAVCSECNTLKGRNCASCPLYLRKREHPEHEDHRGFRRTCELLTAEQECEWSKKG